MIIINEKDGRTGSATKCLHQFLFEYWKVAQKMVEEQQKETR